MSRGYHIGQPLCDSHEFPERRDPWYGYDPQPVSHADIFRAIRAQLWMVPLALLVILATAVAWSFVVAVAGPGPTA